MCSSVVDNNVMVSVLASSVVDNDVMVSVFASSVVDNNVMVSVFAPFPLAAEIVCVIFRKRKYELHSSNQSILPYLYS